MAGIAVGGTACGGGEAPPPESEPEPPTIAGHVVEGVRQGDGEVPSPNRGEIAPQVKRFLWYSVFWTGGSSVRLEVPPPPDAIPDSPMRFVWINPSDITGPKRMGSDITLVTDPSPQSYSPRSCEVLNDGNSVQIVPRGLRMHQLSGGTQLVQIDPLESIQRYGMRFLATRAQVRDDDGREVPGVEDWRNPIGYQIFLDLPAAPGIEAGPLSIWYTGPLSPNLADEAEQMSFVDIVIAPVGPPSVITPPQLAAIARAVNARALVPVGWEARPDGQAFINSLTQGATIPLWIPELHD